MVRCKKKGKRHPNMIGIPKIVIMVYYGIVMTVMTMNGFHDQPLNLIQLDHGRVFRYNLGCGLPVGTKKTCLHSQPAWARGSANPWFAQSWRLHSYRMLQSYRVTELHAEKERCRKLSKGVSAETTSTHCCLGPLLKKNIILSNPIKQAAARKLTRHHKSHGFLEVNWAQKMPRTGSF